MHFMNLNKLSNFIQVLNIKRKHYTKNEYFPKHIIFTKIYSLRELKLNHRHDPKHKIIMSNFV
jgi:hypothetical protein